VPDSLYLKKKITTLNIGRRDIIESCGLKSRKGTYPPLKYYQLEKDNKGEYVPWTSVAKNHNLLKKKLPGQYLNR
jgi:hypothetical protein